MRLILAMRMLVICHLTYFDLLEEDDNGEEIMVWHRSIDGKNYRYTTEPNTGFWHRFGVGFLSLLQIESLP